MAAGLWKSASTSPCFSVPLNKMGAVAVLPSEVVRSVGEPMKRLHRSSQPKAAPEKRWLCSLCLFHALCPFVPLKTTGKHSLLLRPSVCSQAGGKDGPGRREAGMPAPQAAPRLA